MIAALIITGVLIMPKAGPSNPISNNQSGQSQASPLGLAVDGTLPAGINPSGSAAETQNAAFDQLTTSTATIQPSPTSTATIEPSPTPTQIMEPLIELPGGRLAVVNAVGGIHSIRVINFRGGAYPQSQVKDVLSNLGYNSMNPPDDYNLAWWPDWCDNDRTLLFEAQVSRSGSPQTIYSVPSDFSNQAYPWQNMPQELGVPRCSNNDSATVLYGARESIWNIYKTQIYSPTPLDNKITFDTSLSGYPSWSGGNDWFVYMHFNGSIYSLFKFDFSTQRSAQLPDFGHNETRYPAVSPTTNQVAFACADQNWNLCITDANFSDVAVVVKDLVPWKTYPQVDNIAVPQVTPWWSPDGQWIAYSRYTNNHYQIFLYSLQARRSFNLTGSWGGDQFEPNWSKHE